MRRWDEEGIAEVGRKIETLYKPSGTPVVMVSQAAHRDEGRGVTSSMGGT